MSIQGQILEVRVLGGRKLRDTEFFTRQDPYVCLEYANTKVRTRTCTDGGRNPTFDDKFLIPLIEGLRELNIVVWNSNILTSDDFIGSGRVQLHRVLTHGYDDSSWPLQTRHMRSAGEVKLIMHFDISAMKKTSKSIAMSTTKFVPPIPAPVPAPTAAPAVPHCPSPPSYPSAAAYPAASAYPAYPTPSTAAHPTSAYPPTPSPAAHPTSAHPPTNSPAAYPPTPSPAAHPTSAHPPTNSPAAYPPTPSPAVYPPTLNPAAYPPTLNPAAYPPPPHQPYPPVAYPPTAYSPQLYGQPYPPPPPAAQSSYPPAPYPRTYPPPY